MTNRVNPRRQLAIGSVAVLTTALTFGATVTPAPAYAQSGAYYRATLQQPVEKRTEIIRGGIQSLPGGPEEAAQALGLGYWHRIGHIILPQAFRNALPATINQLVITFKETSLVVIIGFFEILASGNAAYGNSEWNFAHVEVYAFVGLIYFVFVFALSRYGAYLERRMAVAER